MCLHLGKNVVNADFQISLYINSVSTLKLLNIWSKYHWSFIINYLQIRRKYILPYWLYNFLFDAHTIYLLVKVILFKQSQKHNWRKKCAIIENLVSQTTILYHWLYTCNRRGTTMNTTVDKTNIYCCNRYNNYEHLFRWKKSMII